MAWKISRNMSPNWLVLCSCVRRYNEHTGSQLFHRWTHIVVPWVMTPYSLVGRRQCYCGTLVDCVWNVMAHGDARVGKWRENKRTEWVSTKRHMTAEHRLARAVQTLQADVHSSPASSRLNWRHRQFKLTRKFRGKTKSSFSTCAITFKTQSSFRAICYDKPKDQDVKLISSQNAEISCTHVRVIRDTAFLVGRYVKF
jgi:hypothetical protein